MRKLSILIGIAILTGGIVTGLSINVSAEESLIPSWIKSTAGFWVDGGIGDAEFLSALQYLVKERMLVIPSDEENVVVSTPTTTSTPTKTFPDPTKDPWDYVERYNTEQSYKNWFHDNYPGKTIYEVVGLPEPEFPSEESIDTNSFRSTDADWYNIRVESDGYPPTALEVILQMYKGKTDENSKHVSVDGYGKIQLVNSNDETVYSGIIQVKEEDFGWYTRILTGEDFLAAYHTIPFEDIKKSHLSDGTVYFQFYTKGGNWDESVFDVSNLPTFSSEEISALFENEYDEKSIVVNKKMSKGNFEVIVNKVGYFKEKPYSFSDTEEYFRVDMIIKNIGNEKDRASLNSLVIIDDKNRQYEKEYGGTLDTSLEQYPGVEKDGYIIFEKIPDDVKNIRLLFELGRNSQYDPYLYEFNIALGQ